MDIGGFKWRGWDGFADKDKRDHFFSSSLATSNSSCFYFSFLSGASAFSTTLHLSCTSFCFRSKISISSTFSLKHLAISFAYSYNFSISRSFFFFSCLRVSMTSASTVLVFAYFSASVASDSC